MTALSHSVLIATRNRPDDLRLALESLCAGQVLPDEVVIIDSSDDRSTEELVDTYGSGTEAVSWVYLHTEPGLPRQRNLGIQRARGDVIHFLDDDVELDGRYLSALDSFLSDEEHDEVAGVGGMVTNQEPRHPRIWWRLCLLDSVRQGVVLASGHNVITAEVGEPLRVDWLSGCSMSFRSEVFARERFDESLAGYALMEDADFSYRVSRTGALYVVPTARLLHHTSPVGRWSFEQRHRAGVYRRYWFVRKNMRPANVIAFVWSVTAGAAVEAMLGFLTFRRIRVRVAGWWILGLVDVLRGRR